MAIKVPPSTVKMFTAVMRSDIIIVSVECTELMVEMLFQTISCIVNEEADHPLLTIQTNGHIDSYSNGDYTQQWVAELISKMILITSHRIDSCDIIRDSIFEHLSVPIQIIV